MFLIHTYIGCGISNETNFIDYKIYKLAGNLKILPSSFEVHAIMFKELLITFQYMEACLNERKKKRQG